MKFINKLLRDEAGATAIEYGLIAALIAVAIIGGAEAIGGSIGGLFDDVSTKLDGAVTPAAPATP